MQDLNSTFIFAPSQIDKAAHIAQLIDKPFHSDWPTAVYTDADMVLADLKIFPHRHCLAVLLAANYRELQLMVDMAPWLEAATVIIMVPDHRRKTIAMAHRLRPRYLVWPEINYFELSMVLKNIITRNLTRTKRGNILCPGRSALLLRARPEKYIDCEHPQIRHRYSYGNSYQWPLTNSLFLGRYMWAPLLLTYYRLRSH